MSLAFPSGLIETLLLFCDGKLYDDSRHQIHALRESCQRQPLFVTMHPPIILSAMGKGRKPYACTLCNRNCAESVAPVDMNGSTGTPPNSCALTFTIVVYNSVSRAEFGAAKPGIGLHSRFYLRIVHQLSADSPTTTSAGVARQQSDIHHGAGL